MLAAPLPTGDDGHGRPVTASHLVQGIHPEDQAVAVIVHVGERDLVLAVTEDTQLPVAHGLQEAGEKERVPGTGRVHTDVRGPTGLRPWTPASTLGRDKASHLGRYDTFLSTRVEDEDCIARRRALCAIMYHVASSF